MATILERLTKILQEKYSIAPQRVTPEATLESLGLDSLDYIELLFEVEEEFNLRVPQESGGAGTVSAATVGDIVQNISNLMSLEGAPGPTQ